MRRSGRSCTLFRLTVARRRRLFHVDPGVGRSLRTVFPCTKSAVLVGGRGGPLGVIQMPRMDRGV